MSQIYPEVTPESSSPTPMLSGNLINRWSVAFTCRREDAFYRRKFMFYSMLFGQVISAIVVLLIQFVPTSVTLIALALVVLAGVQFSVLYLTQRQKLGAGTSGQRVGFMLEIILIVYAIGFTVTSTITQNNLPIMLILNTLVILLTYLVLMTQKVWFIQIDQGDVLLTHASESYERDINVRGRHPPSIPAGVANAIAKADENLYAQVYQYFDFDMPQRMQEDLLMAWTGMFTEAPHLLAELVEALNQIAPLKSVGESTIGAPHSALTRLTDHMKRVRADYVLWIRPGEPCHLIWNQTDFVSITTQIQDIATQDGIPLDLEVSLTAFVDPEKIKVHGNLRELAKVPSRDTVTAFVEYMLGEQVRQAAIKTFARYPYIEAFKPETQDAFCGLLSPSQVPDHPHSDLELPDLEPQWGVLIYEPSITINLVMPQKLRGVLEEYVTAGIKAETNISRMRQHLKDIESTATDHHTKEYIKLQIIALNAIEESSVHQTGRRGSRSRRNANTRIVIPEPDSGSRGILAGKSMSQAGTTPPKPKPTRPVM